MAHVPHRFKVYKRAWHALILIGIMLLPIIFIFLIGGISEISIHNLLSAISISLYRLVLSYFLALILGVVLAILFGRGKIGDFFIPIFDMFQNFPSFALIPIFVLLFGYTNEMAIIFALTSMLWPILFSVLNAFRTAKTDFNEAATVFGALGLKRVFHYLIPLSFPSIIMGSLIGIAIGWEAVIGIEIIGLNNGIGVFLNSAASVSDRYTLAVGIITLLLIVFSLNRLIWLPLIRKSQLYGE